MDAIARHGQCRGLSAKRFKWQCQRKGSAKEQEVSIDFYIIDSFELMLKSSTGSLRHIKCDQTFQRIRTSTITRPLKELLNSTYLMNQVANMLNNVDYGFLIFVERIAKFIHKEANTLSPEYQMVRIIVELDDITKIKFDEGSILAHYATYGLEIVEHNSSPSVDEEAICSICVEKLLMDDSKKDETVIILRTPCAHMFHRNCIETWLKRKRTCPMCRFKIKIKFRVQKDEQIWTCETDFHDLMFVTLDSGMITDARNNETGHANTCDKSNYLTSIVPNPIPY